MVMMRTAADGGEKSRNSPLPRRTMQCTLVSNMVCPSYSLDDLFEFAKNGDESSLVRALVAVRAKISVDIVVLSLDSRKWTLLQYIATNGLTRAALVLLDFARENMSSEVLSEALAIEGAAGHSPLLMGVVNSYEEIACELIKCGAAFDGVSGRGRNCIYMMARNNLCNAMEILWQTRDQQTLTTLGNAIDTNGYTALHAAALMGHHNMCRLLLTCGICGVALCSRDGSNTLHLASRLSSNQPSSSKSAATVQVLLEHILGSISHGDLSQTDLGQSPLTAPDCFGSTPLHIAASCCNDQAALTFIEFVQPICSLVAQDNDGYHPTHIACHTLGRILDELSRVSSAPDRARLCSQADACVLILEKLLHAGYPLSSTDHSDCSVLHSLAVFAHMMDMDEKENDHLRRALICALDTAGSDTAVTELVLRENCDGWTCLHVAKSKQPTELGPFFSIIKSRLKAGELDSVDLTKPKQEIAGIPARLRCGAHNRISVHQRKAILQGDYTLVGVCDYLKRLPHTPRVVVVAGAGISTAAGIKDFRSENGLYATGSTAQMFSLEYLTAEPDNFYRQLRELFFPVIDGSVRPTKAHALLRLLSNLGWLLRVYTQNIDMLEQQIGLRPSQVVECHGSCSRAYCINQDCEGNRFRIDSDEEMTRVFWALIQDDADFHRPSCELCGSLLRPDVTFFGEPLPEHFGPSSMQDLPNCDLVLVMGTSLVVYPVASLPQMAAPSAVRVLINREPTGCFQFVPPAQAASAPVAAAVATSYQQWDTSQYRDVFQQGSCDSGAEEFARSLGRADEFAVIVQEYCREYPPMQM